MARKRRNKRRPPGTGYILPLEGGRAKAHYPKPSGGYYVKRCDSVADAEEWLKDFEKRTAAKMDTTGGQQTLGTWLARWLTGRAGKLKAKTQADYAYKLGYLGPIAGMRLVDILPDHIDDLLNSLNLAETTVRQIRNLLKRALQEALRRRYVTFNAAESEDEGKAAEKREPVRLSVAQSRTLLGAADGFYALAWWLLVCLGLRAGELCGLRRGDIDLAAAVVTIGQQVTDIRGKATIETPKTKKSARKLPIPRALLPAIEAHLAALTRRAADGTRRGTWQEHGLVFPGRSGRPMNPTSLRHALKDLTDATRLPAITVHMLRHTAAGFLIDAETPENVIGAILGHAPSSITGHYAPPPPEVMRPWVEKVYRTIAGDAERERLVR